jgi:hypothetical protein
LPLAASSIGSIFSSTVPGCTVERITMVWNSRFSRNAVPICSDRRRIAVRSWLPFAADGVPTQTNEISVSEIARRASLVTETRPESTTSAINSWIPSSRIGDLRLRIRPSFVGSMSTPMTRCPSRARQASDTAPT